MGTLRTAATVASVSFLIQSCVWIVLSMLAILAHTCHFNPKYDEQLDQSFTSMAQVYFTDPSCWRGGTIIGKLGLTNGSQMITIVSLQFVFNLLLAIVSLVLLFVIPRGSSFTFLIWLYKLICLSVAVAIMDLVTSTMFSSDKDLISTGAFLTPEASGLKSMLTVVSLIAARGYLYWVLNVILILYLLITATRRLFKACRKLDEMKNSGNVNEAFEIDENGYPKYSARSRWPTLGMPLWKRQLINQLYEHRDQTPQRERAAFGSREPLEQRTNFRELSKPNYVDQLEHRQASSANGWQSRWQRNEDSPVQNRGQNQIKENSRAWDVSYERQRQENLNVPRPNSLHEAILTLKPLRQVRPKIPEMQSTRY